VTLVANMTRVVLPDGVATLPYDPSVVLVADAAQGVVWRINTADGKYSQAIDDPALKPTDAVPLGVNGIHIQDDELYFTNLATNTVGRIPITSDGNAAGPVQLLTSKALAADDFALSDNGTVYAAGFNALWQVTGDGRTTAFVGGPNNTVVQGITSARIGRTEMDKDVLYMSTQGGLLARPPGSAVHGGQLLAVNVNAVSSGDSDD
jgi:sugar lactone lactonase YvrE